MSMFELMRKMLDNIDDKEIKKDKDFQILKGIYKIPDGLKDTLRQNKIK